MVPLHLLQSKPPPSHDLTKGTFLNPQKSPDRITLIAGGGGFIGQSLINSLLRGSPRKIVVIGRSHVPKLPLPNHVTYLQGSILDAAFIAPLLEQADEVVDLAYGSVPKTSFDDPLLDVISNLPASVTLQRMASRAKIQRYLLVSSGGTVYGNAQSLPINETHPTDPISPYGISKLVTEKYGTFFHQMEGLPLIIARPGNPYGIGQFGLKQQGFIGAAMHAALHGGELEIFGAKGTIRDYIHIDDLADGLAATLDYGDPGQIYNIGTCLGYNNMGVLATLHKVISNSYYNIHLKHCPARPFDVQANILDSTKLTQISGWTAKLNLTDGIAMTWEKVLNEKTEKGQVLSCSE